MQITGLQQVYFVVFPQWSGNEDCALYVLMVIFLALLCAYVGMVRSTRSFMRTDIISNQLEFLSEVLIRSADRTNFLVTPQAGFLYSLNVRVTCLPTHTQIAIH
jgi:hypothetical protein